MTSLSIDITEGYTLNNVMLQYQSQGGEKVVSNEEHSESVAREVGGKQGECGVMEVNGISNCFKCC